MADRDIGRSEPLIPPAGKIDKAGTAPDRRKRRDQPRHQDERRDEHRERRADDPATKKWRRLFDLLFDEIDRVPGVRDEQRRVLRDNLRAHVVARAGAERLREPTEEEVRALLEASDNPDDHLDLRVDLDRVLDAAVPGRDGAAKRSDADDDLALQFRRCLEVNTSTARKVALYLTLLMRLSDALKPHISVDA